MASSARSHLLPVATIGLALLGVTLGLGGRLRPIEAATVTQSESPAQAFSNLGLSVVDEGVGDVSWSDDGLWLAYSKRDPLDRYLKIWVARADGSSKRCLTCEPPAPSKHCGSPAWHPTGEYLVFSAENEDVRSRKADRLAESDRGLHTNLWAMTADGTRSWQLTSEETDLENPKGAIRPQFSRDGKRLAWAGTVPRGRSGPGYEWGEWALFIADFDAGGTAPALRNVRMVQPGEQHSFYKMGDWSPDGSCVLFSGNLSVPQPVDGQDVYEYEVATGALRRLTASDAEWDEQPRYAPDGQAIFWVSTRALGVRVGSIAGVNWLRDLRSEWWVMKRDGSERRRLTWFNQPGRRDYEWFREMVSKTPRVHIADGALNPDGSRAALVLMYELREDMFGSVLAMIDLDRRRPDWMTR